MKQRGQQLYILILLPFLSGCRSESYEYKGEDGRTRYTLAVPVGSSTASFELGTVTNLAYPVIESDYPTIVAHYSSAANEVNNIERLDIALKVDGKEIRPDDETYQANYFNTSLELGKETCCAGLGQKRGIDVSQKNNPHNFSVDIVKKYKSLKTLPKQITVVLSATSAKGTTVLEKTLNLSSYHDKNFIRVH